jgi:Ion transport protein
VTAPDSQVVVNALFQSIPASANVLLVCLLFYLVFGILFVDLLKGEFENCQSQGERLDPDYYLAPEEQPMTQQWCEVGEHRITGNSTYYHSSIPAQNIPDPLELKTGNVYTLTTQWISPPGNFNNIFVALMSLFEIASLELWEDFMHQGVDATEPRHQPIQGHNPKACLYFIAFVIVGSFFVLNLFVGVAIDKFNQMQAEHLGQNIFLTPEQEQWVTIQRLMSKCKPSKANEPPAQPFRAAIFRVCRVLACIRPKASLHACH